MAWANRGGLRFYYERAGSGPPLLFISGTGGDLRNRPNAFDYAFTSTFDTVAYDQRGLGQSDQPPGPYTMAAYADDAAGILDTVGLERAAVIGVSLRGNGRSGVDAAPWRAGHPVHPRLHLCRVPRRAVATSAPVRSTGRGLIGAPGAQ